MTVLHKIVTAIVICSCTAPLMAQRAGNIRGTGGLGCGAYLEHRTKKLEGQENLYVQWVWAYLSAYNHFSTYKQVDLPEAATILAYTDKYCRENPLGIVAGAATTLIGELGGWKTSK